MKDPGVERARRSFVCWSSRIVLAMVGASVMVNTGLTIHRSLQYASSSSSTSSSSPWSQELSLIPRSLPTDSAAVSTSSTAARPRDDYDNDCDDKKNYNLAREQSFGFLTDISNHNWKLLQQIHAKMIPNHFESLEKSATTGIKNKEASGKAARGWYLNNFHPEFTCLGAKRIPTNNKGDGPKWVCDAHRLKQQKECLVYSVGSNGKTEFEQGILDEIGSHCEIHTFDLIRYNRRFGDFGKALEGISTFHHWGFGRHNKKLPQKTYKTLQQTMDELGHTNRTIDIFKIDCEGCEFSIFRDWLKQDIRQLLVETHMAPMPNARDFFYSLHDAGYVIFSKEPNLYAGGALVEYAMLKLRTDFFVNNSTYASRIEASADAN